jgi:hypothetical protein
LIIKVWKEGASRITEILSKPWQELLESSPSLFLNFQEVAAGEKQAVLRKAA